MIVTKRINKSLKDVSIISYNMCMCDSVKYFGDLLGFLYFSRIVLHQSMKDISSNKIIRDSEKFDLIMKRKTNYSLKLMVK